MLIYMLYAYACIFKVKENFFSLESWSISWYFQTNYTVQLKTIFSTSLLSLTLCEPFIYSFFCD